MSRIRLTKIAQPSNPPANTMEIYYDTSLTKPAIVDASGNLVSLGGFATKDYRLIKVTVITVPASGATYTPTAGTKAIFVECVGGGGAGGGVINAATNSGGGGGGGGGGYASAFIGSGAIKASYLYTIGAAQVGVSGANGNAGLDTTFDSPSVVTGKGGAFGAVDTIAVIHVGGAGGLGGVAGVGDNTPIGIPGDCGLALAAAQAVGGKGGDSFFGGGAIAKINATAAGNNGLGYGGGGGGACAISGGATQTGGNGMSGMIRVWEFA